jgi:hypothetical protein
LPAGFSIVVNYHDRGLSVASIEPQPSLPADGLKNGGVAASYRIRNDRIVGAPVPGASR